jgi:GT2 family glycosyltransferase
MNTQSPSISVVIPNWNGEELLRKNLPIVLAASPPATEIIVVDDGSKDRSVEFVRSNYPNVIVITKPKSQGFATAVNAGVKRATSDIVYLMNTDVAPQDGYLAPVIPHFQNHRIFAVGSLEKSLEGNSIILRGRGLSQWRRGFFIHKRGEVNKLTTAWVAGGSGAFRRSVWLSLGGMDTIYSPFYWEDIDLSYRAMKAGYSLIFESKSVVLHAHEQGAITKHFSSWKIREIAYRNQLIFHWKNISDSGIIFSHLLWLPIRLVQAVFHLDTAMIIGFLAALMRIPHIGVRRLQALRYWKISDDACVLTK